MKEFSARTRAAKSERERDQRDFDPKTKRFNLSLVARQLCERKGTKAVVNQHLTAD